jgi:hypothetical protein
MSGVQTVKQDGIQIIKNASTHLNNPLSAWHVGPEQQTHVCCLCCMQLTIETSCSLALEPYLQFLKLIQA